MGSAAEAFSALAALARGATEAALPTPKQDKQADFLRGIAFNVASVRLLTVVGEVQEVIDLPMLTRVPGTAAWLLGIANVRGRILPIIDVCAFLGFEKSVHEDEWRIFVIERGESTVGLVVEQVFGMMQFEDNDAELAEKIPVGNALDPYLRAAYQRRGRRWRVMDVGALALESAGNGVAA